MTEFDYFHMINQELNVIEKLIEMGFDNTEAFSLVSFSFKKKEPLSECYVDLLLQAPKKKAG